MSDDENLDLSAWQPPPPGPVRPLADAVLARLREPASAAAFERATRRRPAWMLPSAIGALAGALAATAVTLTAVFLLWPAPAATPPGYTALEEQQMLEQRVKALESERRELQHTLAAGSVPAISPSQIPAQIPAPLQAPQAPQAPCDADTPELAGDQALANNQPREALAHYGDAISCEPSNTRAISNAVMTACQVGEIDVARRHFNELPATTERDTVRKMCETYHVALDAPTGRLHVMCRPAANILVDNIATGRTTPTSLVLAAGKHRVTFQIGEDKYSFPVVIKAGEAASLDKDFLSQ